MAWHSRRAGLEKGAVLAVALVLLALLIACGEATSSSPTALPTASPNGLGTFVPTPVSSPTSTPMPPVTPSAYRLVYREFGREQDIIWSVVPSDPSQREQLAVVPHRADWGIIPSLSPDGKLLAYTTLPAGAIDPSFQAEAHLLELETGKTELIAKAVDLRLRPPGSPAGPVWSPDGGLLFLRRFVEQDVMILQVDVAKIVEDSQVGPTVQDEEEEEDPIKAILKADVSDVLTFIPIGFADDEESMYFVQVEGGTGAGAAGGTVLGAYAPATVQAIATATAIAQATAAVQATATAAAPPPTEVVPPPTEVPPPSPTPQATFVVRLSDQIARDYDLSPDSRKLVFLVQELVEGRFLFRAFVADLVARSVAPLSIEGLPPGDHLRPLWHPDGTRVALGQLPVAGEPGAVALVPLDGGPLSFLAPPDVGFDVPLSWAPDGLFLAVTHIKGDSLFSPERALVLVAPTGQRLTVAEGVDVEVIGWLKKE